MTENAWTTSVREARAAEAAYRATATGRALMCLVTGPQSAGDVGQAVWPERERVRVANHGGGDYAAQMLLGRLKRAGLVRHAPSDGSTLWEITNAGRARIGNGR